MTQSISAAFSTTLALAAATVASVVLVTLPALPASATAGETALIERTPTPARASFRLTGPMGIAIVGKTPDVRVVDDGDSIAVVVGLQKLSTGLAFRDEHMRTRHLEVARHPETRLVVDKALIGPTQGARDATAKGLLTLHGVTRLVPFTYRATCAAKTCDVAGSATVDMNAFGIVVEPYLGLTVERDVVVDVFFQTTRP